MLYLRFNDERKRLMREMEESKLIIGSGNDSARKGFSEKNNDLDKIPEEEEGDAANCSEDYDIYNHQNSNLSESKNASKTSSKNNSQSQSRNLSKKSSQKDNKLNLFDNNSNFQKKNSLLENHGIINKSSVTNVNQQQSMVSATKGKGKESANSVLSNQEQNSRHYMKDANTNSMNYKEKETNYFNKQKSREEKNGTLDDSDKISQVMKNIANPENEAEEYSANDINHMNYELSEAYDKKKEKINKNFMERIDKVIEYVEENEVCQDENTLELLKKLKNTQDAKERTEIIEKIEKMFNSKNDKEDK